MLTIETKELKIRNKLKRKIDMIGRLTNAPPQVNNGCIKNMSKKDIKNLLILVWNLFTKF